MEEWTSAFYVPSLLTAWKLLTPLTSPLSTSVPITTHAFSFFLNQKNSSFSEHHKLMFLFSVGQLGGRARVKRFCPTGGRMETEIHTSFPFCFLHKINIRQDPGDLLRYTLTP
jgi:hypothetical protein